MGRSDGHGVEVRCPVCARTLRSLHSRVPWHLSMPVRQERLVREPERCNGTGSKAGVA